MIRHDDDNNLSSGTCYTLYLEYLGGLLPLLKGKRTSKIRPEFVIFDPQTEGKSLKNLNSVFLNFLQPLFQMPVSFFLVQRKVHRPIRAIQPLAMQNRIRPTVTQPMLDLRIPRNSHGKRKHFRSVVNGTSTTDQRKPMRLLLITLNHPMNWPTLIRYRKK